MFTTEIKDIILPPEVILKGKQKDNNEDSPATVERNTTAE
jgi:hypothetical protein